ncbi:MAG TPA: glycosyltransferase family 9 protein [Miltoncostaea sp.]|nr:glycosyltransferase family 9 protein [Miltoncostaea sp.]
MTGAARPRPRLLVLRALGLGDLLTAVPALRALRDVHPDHEIALACPEALTPLVAMTGAVDRMLPVAPLGPLPMTEAGVDLAVNLHGRGPQSHRVLLATRPRRLLAFGCPEAGVAGPAWRDDEHEVARWCRLLREDGIPADPGRLDLPHGPRRPERPTGVTVVHPGAASGSRRWPPERFAAVARAERHAGRRVRVTGAPAERRLALRVAAEAGLHDDDVLAGRTGLAELARVIAEADRVVCGDTGVGHLATALGTPSVVLFGPVPPSRWGPPAGDPAHRALWAGATGDPHADRVDPGLLRIGVDRVLEELEALPA